MEGLEGLEVEVLMTVTIVLEEGIHLGREIERKRKLSKHLCLAF